MVPHCRGLLFDFFLPSKSISSRHFLPVLGNNGPLYTFDLLNMPLLSSYNVGSLRALWLPCKWYFFFQERSKMNNSEVCCSVVKCDQIDARRACLTERNKSNAFVSLNRLIRIAPCFTQASCVGSRQCLGSDAIPSRFIHKSSHRKQVTTHSPPWPPLPAESEERTLRFEVVTSSRCCRGTI